MFSLVLLQTMLCHRTANLFCSTPTTQGKAPMPMLCHRVVLVRRTLAKPAEAMTSPSIRGLHMETDRIVPEGSLPLVPVAAVTKTRVGGAVLGMTTVKTNLGLARVMRAKSRHDPHERDRMILPTVEMEMGMTTERGIDIENSCKTATALEALVAPAVPTSS
jgi:hypothetical protein